MQSGTHILGVFLGAASLALAQGQSRAADTVRVPVEAPSAVAMAEAESAYVRGDYDRAARLLSTLVEVEQQNAFAWVRLGRALERRGAYQDAWRAYDRAIELVVSYPDDRDARAVELEARRGRSAVSIDAALSDAETLQRVASDPAMRRDAHVLAARLRAAKAMTVSPVAIETTRSAARANGVIRARTTDPAAKRVQVQLIEGGKPKTRN
jgi:tetratricopeptide (TPR) repeat protein